MSMRRLIVRLEEASEKSSPDYDFDVLKHLVYVDEKARKAVLSAASSGDANRLADAVGKLARLTRDVPEKEDWVSRFDGDDEDRDPSDSRAASLYSISADALFGLERRLKHHDEDAAYVWNRDAEQLAKLFDRHMGW